MATIISGTTGIDRVHTDAVTADHIAGTVLQTAIGSSATGTYVNSTLDWETPSGMSVTITPSKTTSKIMVSWSTSVMVLPSTNVGFIYCRIIRNSTQVIVLPAHYANQASEWRTYVEGSTYIDAPNSTSALTYQLQFKTGIAGTDSNVRINQYGGTAFIQASEIGG